MLMYLFLRPENLVMILEVVGGFLWPNYILFIKKKPIKNGFKKRAAWWHKLFTVKANGFASEENAV